jgi:hypothetical protein
MERSHGVKGRAVIPENLPFIFLGYRQLQKMIDRFGIF